MMKLIPPGKRGPCWYIRGTVQGVAREFSTGTVDQSEAQDFLNRFLAFHKEGHCSVEHIEADRYRLTLFFQGKTHTTVIRAASRALAMTVAASWAKAGVVPERERARAPEIIPLGEFEVWLMGTYQLKGEQVVRIHDDRPVQFHRTAGGYLGCTIIFERARKKVLEHRFKFLLANGWLPRSIDHIDRNRWNNLLANLRAATPAIQSTNLHTRAHSTPADAGNVWGEKDNVIVFKGENDKST